MSSDVTIGICVRNGEASIGNAIESVVLQSYPHKLLEVIFVDDGSIDRTLSIIYKYVRKMDIRCKVFSGEQIGLGHARNLVIENAEGEYVIWVDSDNILTENYIQKQVEFMNENRNVGIAVGMFWIQPGANPILTLELAPLIAKYFARKLWEADDVTKLPGAAGTMCRVDLIKKIGGFDKTISGAGEDQDIAKKINEAGWLICRTEATLFETRGGMSTFKDLWNKYFWYGFSAFPLHYRRIYAISIFLVNPFAGFVSGLRVAATTYPLLHRRILFLSPVHFAFKMFAYLRGFNKAKQSLL